MEMCFSLLNVHLLILICVSYRDMLVIRYFVKISDDQIDYSYYYHVSFDCDSNVVCQ